MTPIYATEFMPREALGERLARLRDRQRLIGKNMQVEGIESYVLDNLRREQKSLRSQEKDLLRGLRKLKVETVRDIKVAKAAQKESKFAVKSAKELLKQQQLATRAAQRERPGLMTRLRTKKAEALEAQERLSAAREAVKVRAHKRRVRKKAAVRKPRRREGGDYLFEFEGKGAARKRRTR